MAKTVIQVSELSKIYDLGLVGTGTLSKDLNRFWAKMRGKPDPYATLAELNDRTQKSSTNTVMALKEIDFEVEEGEVLGIIGRNGAGKSTLLKILSQITTPTSGEIKIKGRVASLLEVGTGMHPEMTARQNVYLNGSIMGMTRKEVSAKLEEIIDFAGVGKYIDTPIKRFSSGMKVRLGFAVAAFLEPEILIIDEVLAVGDAEFQKRAVGKMKDVAKGEGRTVLFVSHNMAAVNSLCSSAIVIDKGELCFRGSASEAVNHYLNLGNNNSLNNSFTFDSDKMNGFRLFKSTIFAQHKTPGEPILRDDDIFFESKVENSDIATLFLMYRIKDNKGNFLFVMTPEEPLNQDPGIEKTLTTKIPPYFFNQGKFFVDVQVSNGRKILFRYEDVMSFTVIQEEKKLGEWMGVTAGPLKPRFEWEITHEK